MIMTIVNFFQLSNIIRSSFVCTAAIGTQPLDNQAGWSCTMRRVCTMFALQCARALSCALLSALMGALLLGARVAHCTWNSLLSALCTACAPPARTVGLVGAGEVVVGVVGRMAPFHTQGTSNHLCPCQHA